MNKKLKNYLIDALIIVPIILVIVFFVKSCGHDDDKIIAQLNPYKGVRLSESYDEVIRIVEESSYTYEFCYDDRTLQIEPDHLEDYEWLTKHEITHFTIGKKHVRFGVDICGMKDYKETISNL